MKKMLVYLAIVLMALIPSFASAHLDAGEDKVIGNYLVDFGYAPEIPKVGDHVDISFNLLNNKTQAVIVPGHVWVRLAQGDNVVFSGTFFPENKNVIFSQTFYQAGNYEVTARFFDQHNKLIVESVTNLPVAAIASAPVSTPFFTSTSQIYFFAGSILSVIAICCVARKRS